MSQDVIWNYYQTEGEEVFAASVPRYKFLIRQARKLLANVEKPRVINIGAGSGWLEKQCLALGWQTASLDPSEATIKNLQDAGIEGKTGYIEAIPFADNSFDVVFCSEVLEHLSNEQLPSGIKEIERILSKGGYLIGTVPFNEELNGNVAICPECSHTFHRWGHYQSFNKENFKACFHNSGFKFIKLGTYALRDFSGNSIKSYIKSGFAWILGRLGEPIICPSLFFICKKLK